MADTYSVPGTPRVYIDNVLFARSIGMPLSVTTGNKLLWDMDPVRTVNFSGSVSQVIKSEITFDQSVNNAFSNLLNSSNYFAVLNHNLSTGSGSTTSISLTYNDNVEETSHSIDGTVATTDDIIIGDIDSDITSDGFILQSIELSGESDEFTQLDVNFTTPAEDYSYNIGCFSLGTYLDFPVSPDLSVKMGYSHEGVQSKRTIAGKDLTHVSYSGAPNWGELPPFTITDQYNENVYFSGAGLTGRKTWDMKFSYVDKTDMFNAVQSGSSAGTYTSGGFAETSSIIGTYLSRTLGGKLKHTLQPNRDKDEFYMVKLDQGSTKIKQVTSGVYAIALKFVQVW